MMNANQLQKKDIIRYVAAACFIVMAIFSVVHFIGNSDYEGSFDWSKASNPKINFSRYAFHYYESVISPVIHFIAFAILI